MITYRSVGEFGMSSWRMQVLIAGRRVGDIHPCLNGYRYYPKGSNVGGKSFPTIQEVQKSLEEE